MIYVIMEVAGGGDVYSKAGKLDDKTLARYICSMALALEHCHSQNIVHCDVKPGNTLLSANGEIKLADFGLSVILGTGKKQKFRGSRWYAAPEMLMCLPYGHEVDIWSLGVTSFELLTGKLPFPSRVCKVKRNISKIWRSSGLQIFLMELKFSSPLYCNLIQRRDCL